MSRSRKTKYALEVATLAVCGTLTQSALADVFLTTSSYTQNFDTLPSSSGTWTDNSTLTGWYAGNASAGLTTFTSDPGTSATGGLHVYSNSTDRALGSLGSGSVTTIYFGAKFTNNISGNQITGFDASYTGEQWKRGSNALASASSISFSYSTNALSIFDTSATWITVSALNFTSPIVNATTTAFLDGNTAANRTAISSSVALASTVAFGGALWVRWKDVDDSGADAGLAVDDLSLNFATSATSVATPRDMTWNGAGVADNWDNTTSNWLTASAQAWDDTLPDNANFNGAGAPTVNVSGNRTVGKMTFSSGAYTVNGGTVNLAGAGGVGIISASNTAISSPLNIAATVSADVAGSTTLTLSGAVSGARILKGGSGTLILGASNTFAGVTSSVGTLVVSNDNQLGTGNLGIAGTLDLTGAITSTRAIDVVGPTVILTHGQPQSIGQLASGTGSVTFTGGGTVTFGAAGSTAFAGLVSATDPTLFRITSVDPGGSFAMGIGAGTVVLGGGTNMILENVQVGSSTTGPVVRLNDGANLRTNGTSNIGSKGNSPAVALNANVTITSEGSTSSFQMRNSLRNQASTNAASGSTITISGGGRVILASGATSFNTGDQFSGSWVVDNGTLQVGPGVSASSEVLNALGYISGPLSSTPGAGPNLGARPVTVNSGGRLLVAVNAPGTATNSLTAGTNSLRNPITLNGGALAATTVSSVNFSGPLTIAAASTVETTNFLNAAGSESLAFTNHVAGTDAWVAAPITWNADLHVVAGTAPGTLTFDRSSVDAVTVGASPKLIIDAGATVVAKNTMNPFSDGANYVAIQNDGALSVTAGTKNAGTITGVSGTITGSTSVSATSTLTAATIRQNSLSISDNSLVADRLSDANGTADGSQGAASAVMRVNNLSIDTTSRLDLKNNALVIPATGTYNGSAVSVSSLRAAIIAGRGTVGTGGATWSGAGGIGSTSFTLESANSVGYVWNADPNLLILGGITTVNGESLTSSDYAVKFTKAGDANLDGIVDNIDVGIIGLRYLSALGDQWYQGDFNYDGVVNNDDVAILGLAYAPSASPLSPSYQAPLSENFSAAASVVPEPTSLGLLAIGAMGMLRRRRK